MGTSLRLVVGENPGEADASVGEPFRGGTGTWLDVMLAKARIKRDDLTIINTIQCCPPGNKFPTDAKARDFISKEDGYAAVQQCVRNHVQPLLKSRPWQRVDLLGDKALQFIGEKKPISTWRGSPIEIPVLGDKKIALATWHPQYVMRNQVELPVVINDLKKSLVLPPEKYKLYPSLDDVEKFNAKEVIFDIETPEYWRLGDAAPITIVGISDLKRPYEVLVVPFRGGYLSELRRIFRNAHEVIGHNCIQFDLPRLQRDGVEVGANCQVWDTMLLQHLRFPDFQHDLEFVGSQFSSKPAWKDDKEEFNLYCARDVDVTAQAFRALKPMVEAAGLMDLYKQVQVPLAKICKLMTDTGFKVDVRNIGSIREKFLAELSACEAKLPAHMRTHEVVVSKREPAPAGTLSAKTGKPLKYVMVPGTKTVVPWRSTPTKVKFLYEELGLPTQYDHESGNVTTGKIALDKLYHRTKKPEILAIRRLNQLDELLGTFATEAMQKVERMHPSFNPHGTNSGRLSSSGPNLQNIPESARYVYVPSHSDWCLVDVDYSQIENRLTAFLAGDRERLQRYLDDLAFSEHKLAASVFFGIPYQDVVKDNDKEAPYGKAKRIVHGANYGMGAKKIANVNDMDFKEVKGMLEKWKSTLAATNAWQLATANQAAREGYLSTPFGRKRWFWTSSKYTESLSFIPQSTAADIIYRAMIGMMYERIGWPVEEVRKIVRVHLPLPLPARLLIQVHDSLVFECPSGIVDEVVSVVRQVMQQPWAELRGFTVPIGIKVGAPGASWGECETYKERSRVAVSSV